MKKVLTGFQVILLTMVCSLPLTFGLFLTGCSGLQIEDSATNKTLAYVTGKGMGILINEKIPAADKQLSDAWVALMTTYEGQEMIPSEAIVEFYGEAVTIIASHKIKDPYGFVTDLRVILMIYGGQFNELGELEGVNSVPTIVMKFFELGYDSGRQVALKN